MKLKEIEAIYLLKRDKLLRGKFSQESPIAFILGGQPASGKSGLARAILRQFPDKDFLFVNGDIYREFHPKAKELIKHPDSYSAETQLFSNFFTELGFYLRYQEEIDFQGYGRLADKVSHDKAVAGLLLSLDRLYTEKAVDKIHLYSYQAERHLITYTLAQQWDIARLPSEEVVEARIQQYQDKTLRLQLIEKANTMKLRMSSSIRVIVEELIQKIIYT